jgi:hypothetical protein
MTLRKREKGKAIPLQAWKGPEGSRRLRFPDSRQSVHEDGKVVSPTYRPPLPPGNFPGTHFLLEGESTPGPYCGRKDYVIKNSNDTIENRSRDLPICSAVSQPNAPPHTQIKSSSPINSDASKRYIV